MKVAAIIAEYNPFHNGHKYQIEETKRRTSADYILILMSGNFVQRGGPALCNKYLRTQMALLGGADIVLELPSLYATSSAEFFAGGSISILDHLNTIDYLSFGSETGDIDTLTTCANILVQEPEEYITLLSTLLKKGLSYPLARYKTLDQIMSSTADLKETLSSPNNILGIEYCKALRASNSSITPVTIRRKGSGYHDETLQTNNHSYSSASAIRRSLLSYSDENNIASHIPDGAFHLLDSIQHSELPSFLDSDDFSVLLHYKLLSKQETGFADYLDCTKDISDKICKHIRHFTGFNSFCSLLKSKDLTYTRIGRILLHILLDMKTPDFYLPSLKDRQLFTPYVRLLGFKKEATPLLHEIKKNSSIPVISKLADAHKILSEDALQMLKKDILTCDIYEAVHSSKSKEEPLNEFRQSPIIL